jgi:hypothetical protein
VSGNTDTRTVVAPFLHQPRELERLCFGRAGEPRRRGLDRHLHRAGVVLARAFGDTQPDQPQDARAPLERSAELIGAPVVEGGEELVEQFGIGRAELNAVVARLASPGRDLAVAERHRLHLVGGHDVDRHTPKRRA